MKTNALLLPMAMLLGACSVLTKAPPKSESMPTARFEARPLPGSRHGHRAEVLGSRVVAFGGFDRAADDDDRGSRWTQILDLRSGVWRRGADMNLGRGFFGSAVVDGTIVAIADSIERYDIEADRWSVVAPVGTMPTSHFGAAAIGRRIFALGGFPVLAGGFVGFDLETGRSFDPPEPEGLAKGDHLPVVATIGDEIHFVGGLRDEGFQPIAEHQVFDGRAWRRAAPPPRPTWAKLAAYAVHGRTLYLFDEEGGLRYDKDADRWSTVASIGRGYALVMPAAVVLGDLVHVFGGFFPEPRQELLIYDPARDQWTTRAASR